MTKIMTLQEIEEGLKEGSLRKELAVIQNRKHEFIYGGNKLVARFELERTKLWDLESGERHGPYMIYKEDGKTPTAAGAYNHGVELEAARAIFDATGRFYYMNKGSDIVIFNAEDNSEIEKTTAENVGKRLKELAQKEPEQPAPEPAQEEKKPEEPKPEPKSAEPKPEPKSEPAKEEPKKEEPKPEPAKEEKKPEPKPKEKPAVIINEGTADDKPKEKDDHAATASDENEEVETMESFKARTPSEFHKIVDFWVDNKPDQADNWNINFDDKKNTLAFDFENEGKLNARIEYKTPDNVTLSGVDDKIPHQEYFDKLCAEIASRGDTEISFGKIWDKKFLTQLKKAAHINGLTVVNADDFQLSPKPPKLTEPLGKASRDEEAGEEVKPKPNTRGRDNGGRE